MECRSCNQHLPLENFYPSSIRAHHYRCKACLQTIDKLRWKVAKESEDYAVMNRTRRAEGSRLRVAWSQARVKNILVRFHYRSLLTGLHDPGLILVPIDPQCPMDLHHNAMPVTTTEAKRLRDTKTMTQQFMEHAEAVLQGTEDPWYMSQGEGAWIECFVRRFGEVPGPWRQ